MTHRKDRELSPGARTGKTGKIRNMNRPPQGEPFIWFTTKMLTSEAYAGLSRNGHKALARLLVEHMAHAGSENGNLICTHSDFERAGIRRPSIAAAILELEHFGWIAATRGRAFQGRHQPTVFRLTFLPEKDGSPATNEWKAISAAHVTAFESQRLLSNKTKAANRERRRKRNLDDSAATNVIQLAKVADGCQR